MKGQMNQTLLPKLAVILLAEVARHVAGDGHDVEEHDHEQGDREDEVTEELEELGGLASPRSGPSRRSW